MGTENILCGIGAKLWAINMLWNIVLYVVVNAELYEINNIFKELFMRPQSKDLMLIDY